MTQLLYKFLSLCGIATLGFITYSTPSLASAQEIAFALVATLTLLSFVPGTTPRLLFTSLCAWIVVRYIAWRFASLPISPDHLLSSSAAIALLAAELYGCAMLLLGLITNALPLDRKPSPLPPSHLLPTIDVFIPTYSEPLSIVAPTVMAALELHYPKEKLRVYILDDGHPKSLNPQTPPQQRLQLAQRTEQLQQLAQKHGAIWIGRPTNTHAKSGNINHALPITSGEFILILDADHVPTQDFLTNTVGLFHDPKLAFVQTPHFFLNPDPIERNLNLHNKIPSENDMFYRVIQRSLDLWNASFFCGSAALLRRTALESINGLATTSITEDAASSIKMHQKGWKSAYLDIPMVAGLQPESFAAFITQRLRWGTGMMQIWMQQNPLISRGLTFGQRISYLSVIMFWLFPIARTIFFIAPLLSIFFNLNIYPNGVPNFLAYTAPYILAVIFSFNRIFGHVRAFLMSELFETLQSFYLLPAIISTLIHPSKPTFKVTPKGLQSSSLYVSEFHSPFYIALSITSAALLYGLWRMFNEPTNLAALSLSMAWLAFNFILLMGALGAILEHPQRRERPRAELNQIASATFPSSPNSPPSQHKIVIHNASESGLLLSFTHNITPPDIFQISTSHGPFTVTTIKNSRPQSNQPNQFPVAYSFHNPKQARLAVCLAYGNSSLWQTILTNRQSSTFLPLVALKSISAFLRAGLRHLNFLSRQDS